MYMHDTMEATDNWAALYWVIFIVINVHIFLNIIVAVVFEKMEERGRLQALTTRGNRYSGAAEAIDNFVECWQTFDIDATQLIKTTDLPYFLLMLAPPIGFS